MTTQKSGSCRSQRASSGYWSMTSSTESAESYASAIPGDELATVQPPGEIMSKVTPRSRQQSISLSATTASSRCSKFRDLLVTEGHRKHLLDPFPAAYVPLDIVSWSQAATAEINYVHALRMRANTWYRNLSSAACDEMVTTMSSDCGSARRRRYTTIIHRPTYFSASDAAVAIGPKAVPTSSPSSASAYSDSAFSISNGVMSHHGRFHRVDQETPLELSFKRRSSAVLSSVQAKSGIKKDTADDLGPTKKLKLEVAADELDRLEKQLSRCSSKPTSTVVGESILKRVLLAGGSGDSEPQNKQDLKTAHRDAANLQTPQTAAVGCRTAATQVHQPQMRSSRSMSMSFDRATSAPWVTEDCRRRSTLCTYMVKSSVVDNAEYSHRRHATTATNYYHGVPLSIPETARSWMSSTTEDVGVAQYCYPSSRVTGESRCRKVTAPLSSVDAVFGQARNGHPVMTIKKDCGDVDNSSNHLRTAVDSKAAAAVNSDRYKHVENRKSRVVRAEFVASARESVPIPTRKIDPLNLSSYDCGSVKATNALSSSARSNELQPHAFCVITAVERPVVSARILKWTHEISHFAIAYRDFGGLPANDHATLLQRAHSRLLLLYMAEADFRFSVELTEDDAENVPYTPVDSNGTMLTPTRRVKVETVQKIQLFLKRCRLLHIDAKEYHCMRLISLFHSGPGVCELKRPDLVRRLNTTACQLLRKVSRCDEARAGPDVRRRYAELLLRLRALYGVDYRAVQSLFVTTRND